MTCLLAEARKTESDSNKKLQNLVESLEQHSSKIGLTQVVDTAKLDGFPAMDTLDPSQLDLLVHISLRSKRFYAVREQRITER